MKKKNRKEKGRRKPKLSPSFTTQTKEKTKRSKTSRKLLSTKPFP